jgi:CubicO group peptidase (beta-lactamase class C family)
MPWAILDYDNEDGCDASMKTAILFLQGAMLLGQVDPSSLLEAEVKAGRVNAASILVARDGRVVHEGSFGHGKIFLVASITKPVTATAVMILVERGKVSLNDPVSYYLPEFKGDKRGEIRVRDLLTHTSGLPDMVPENEALRRAHAPLSEFVKKAVVAPLLFAPHTDFSYQSMGVLLAAEIVERVTGQKLRDFEKKEIFDPLGMKDTSLGLGGRRIADLAQCQSASGAASADWQSWGWNSEYWRDLGAPWGGMHTTTRDLFILLQTFLNGGTYNNYRLLSKSAVETMIRDQNGSLHKPWGIGWGLATSSVWSYFGDIVSPRTFGHSGASGTVAWADPDKKLITVILTTRPSGEDNGRLLRTVSNAAAAAF